MSRQRQVELEELRECTFKPMLDEVSEMLAQKRRREAERLRVEEELFEDAFKRGGYKERIKETVELAEIVG